MITHGPTDFQKKVYEKLYEVPKGKVTTYADLAHAVGIASPRAIGQALKRKPSAPIIPCHRVVASDGSIGGFFGQMQGRHVARKIALLRKERVVVREGKVLDFDAVRYRSFDP